MSEHQELDHLEVRIQLALLQLGSEIGNGVGERKRREKRFERNQRHDERREDGVEPPCARARVPVRHGCGLSDGFHGRSGRGGRHPIPSGTPLERD